MDSAVPGKRKIHELHGALVPPLIAARSGVGNSAQVGTAVGSRVERGARNCMKHLWGRVRGGID